MNVLGHGLGAFDGREELPPFVSIVVGFHGTKPMKISLIAL